MHGSMGWGKWADAKVHQLRLTVGGVGGGEVSVNIWFWLGASFCATEGTTNGKAQWTH